MDVKEELSAEQAVAKNALNGAFQEVFSTEAGKRVLFHLIALGSPYEDAFSGDDAVTNYTLGRKKQSLEIINALGEIDARLYPQLLLAMADIREMDRAIAAKQTENQESDDE
ncbi:hypothetical protein AX761_21765 [Rhizobium sp. 58]|nr:hypothetical protein AX761_21765 [Rhizobium sp. 58]